VSGWVLGPITDIDSPAGQLAQAQRELTDRASVGSLRAFAKLVNFGPTTISDALSGDPRKVPTAAVIEAICKICGADEPTLARLRVMRAAAIKSKPPVDPSPPPCLEPVDPPPPTPPPSLAVRWRLLGLLFVVLVGLVVGWQLWPNECGGAFSGIRLNDKVDGECIGITDGNYLFNDPVNARNEDDRKTIEGLIDVEKKIEAENSAVARADRYVKVVLLMPLTVSQARPSAISREEILHSLEGSYIALYRANHSHDFGDPSAVRLQLLLANQGSRQDVDPDFIDDIVKVSQPDHPVVAVIGLDSSTPNMKTAVEHLAQQGIPMVSAVASADDLTNLPLLWSVSPSNLEYAGRLKSFLDHQDVLRSGIIVYDRNPDLYTQSLARAYHDQLGRYVKFPDQPFQGNTIDTLAVPDVFFPVVTNLCNAANDPHAPLDMVFYAGRGTDFGAFTAALKARTCLERSLTVLTASTGFPALRDYEKTVAGSNIRVVVATWPEPGTSPGYAAFLAASHDRGFVGDTDLVDGYAIAHHDALATATQAIRLASLGTQTHTPNPEDVAGQFGHLNLAYVVRAASGTLSFPPEGGRASRVPDQSISITQIG
jgi:ABC-type branched-subunit amino acid transport system substrate-binding protein